MKKRLMICAFAAVALVGAAAAAMLRSPSTALSAGTAAMPSLQERHAAAGVNKEIEDQSLIFPGWRSARSGRRLIEPTRTVSDPMSIQPSGEPAAIGTG